MEENEREREKAKSSFHNVKRMYWKHANNNHYFQAMIHCVSSELINKVIAHAVAACCLNKICLKNNSSTGEGNI